MIDVSKALHFAGIVLAAASAWACAQTRELAAWEYYDGCAIQTTTFVGLVNCGDERIKAICGSSRSGLTCGPVGSAVAAYADSLAKSIENKTLTEGEARRKWAQFELLPASEQIRLSQAAVGAAAANK